MRLLLSVYCFQQYTEFDDRDLASQRSEPVWLRSAIDALFFRGYYLACRSIRGEETRMEEEFAFGWTWPVLVRIPISLSSVGK